MIDYRIEYDLAGLVLLIIIFIYFFFKKKHDSLQSRKFFWYLTFAFVNMVVDIITVFCIRYVNSIPLWINYTLNSIYYMMQFLLPTLFLLYVVQMVNTKEEVFNKFAYLFCIPAILGCIIMVFVNPFTKSVFYFEEGIFKNGNLHILIYLNELLYILISIILAFVHKKAFEKNKIYTLLGSVLIVVIFSSIQIVERRELSSGFGIALSILIIFLSFQDPKDELDSLTGTMNKTAFAKTINEHIKHGKKFSAFGFALTDFSLINNTYGASIGDLIIIKVSKDCSNLVDNQKIFRFGGDKFVFLADTDIEAKLAVDKILDYFNEPIMVNDISIYVKARTAVVPQETIIDFKFLVRQIDYAFKRVKENEKSHYFTLSKSDNETLQKEIFEESKIGEAIDNRLFEMHFQPLYNSKTGKYSASEALLRLNVEGYGYINPENVINYAESHNKMIYLGLAIIEKVFQFISQTDMKKLGIEKIHINLSIAQCMDTELSKEVLKLSSKYNIDNSLIGFEITESQKIISQSILLKNMNDLINNGFEFSLDDYGTGYSTLDYVLTLPFDTIKIDQRIVMKLMTNKESQTIIKYTIKMFQSLNKHIVVEGVETKEIDSFINDLNVDYIQGYFHSKPLSELNYLKFLESNE